MNHLAGVDEAGVGPILGPLVVAGVALAGPRGASPWTLLADVVSRERSQRGKIRVADSKKVHQGRRGLLALERTVLSFWTAFRGGETPTSVGALLRDCGTDLEALRPCPWYRDLDLPLPLRADAREIELLAHRLGRSLERTGTRILHIAVRPVDVEEFNGLIARTDSKSRAHFWAYAQVIAEVLRVLPADAHVVADRCGALARYLPSLRRAYPGAEIAVLREDAAISSYLVGTRRGRVRVTFAVQGEDRAFPTALASCTAKYFREMMLQCLNRWFRQRSPGLRPTAGYVRDGLRFLADVAPIVRAENVPRSRLVRVR